MATKLPLKVPMVALESFDTNQLVVEKQIKAREMPPQERRTAIWRHRAVESGRTHFLGTKPPWCVEAQRVLAEPHRSENEGDLINYVAWEWLKDDFQLDVSLLVAAWGLELCDEGTVSYAFGSVLPRAPHMVKWLVAAHEWIVFWSGCDYSSAFRDVIQRNPSAVQELRRLKSTEQELDLKLGGVGWEWVEKR